MFGDGSQTHSATRRGNTEKHAMLKAYHGEWNKENSPKLAPQPLGELVELVDRLAAAPRVSSYGGGASGHHAWIIVSDHGFDLEIYFGESTGKDSVVDFVLYGPYSDGEKGSIYDGRGLYGEITTACLKGLLALLDEGSSPLEYLHASALEVSVVTD